VKNPFFHLLTPINIFNIKLKKQRTMITAGRTREKGSAIRGALETTQKLVAVVVLTPVAV
jgi:hypothetical protein